jgi:2-iminobutanoate/2-iminopropanoate deaminase
MKKIIHTPDAPAPIGPYSQAVLAGNTLYISGQIAINPHTGELETNEVMGEAHRVMKNLEAILGAAGFSFADVVKTGIFLSDMALFNRVNEVYASYFSGDYPARETVAVRTLPRNVNVEISMIAVK